MASDAQPPGGALPRGRSRRFPYLALLAWLLFALVVPRLVQSLNIVDVLGLPLGFFMAAEGALIALLVIAVLSARRLDRMAAAEDERGGGRDGAR